MAYRRPPNLNTKYGRRRARQEAAYRYQTGTPEYKAEVDEIGCWVWFVVILICAGIFFLISVTKGPDAAIKWLK